MSDMEIPLSLPWQQEQWSRIIDLHRKNTLAHSLLLSGQPGIGKSRFARALAQYLICSEPLDGRACGRCRQCVLNRTDTHPDIKILEPEEKGKQIKIDQVRQLVEFLSKTSQQGGYKVAILNPAENMNLNSANALLKSLEEPSADTLLLLVCDSPSRLLPTIRSRCQKVGFSVPTKSQSLAWLTPLIPSQQDVENLLLEASGQPVTALEILESDGISHRREMSEQLSALLSGRETPVSMAEKWQHYDIPEALSWMHRNLRAVINKKMTGNRDGATEAGAEWLQRSDAVNLKNLFVLADKLLLLRQQLESGANPNKQLALEVLMIELENLFSQSAI